MQLSNVKITQETLVKIHPCGHTDGGLRHIYLGEIEQGLVRLERLLMRYRSVTDDVLYFRALMELEAFKRCATADTLELSALISFLHSVLRQAHTLAHAVSEQRGSTEHSV